MFTCTSQPNESIEMKAVISWKDGRGQGLCYKLCLALALSCQSRTFGLNLYKEKKKGKAEGQTMDEKILSMVKLRKPNTGITYDCA